ISTLKDAVPSALSTPIAAVLIGICIILIIYEIWFENLRYVKLGKKDTRPLDLAVIRKCAYDLKKKSGCAELCNMKMSTTSSEIRYALLYGFRLGHNTTEVHRNLVAAYGDNAPSLATCKRWFACFGSSDFSINDKPQSGEKWKSHRKMISPTFHSSILKTFMPVFNKNANRLVERFKKELGKSFDVHDYMSEITVDTLLETVMGVEKTDNDNTGFEYAMSVMKMCNILHLRHYKLWLRPDFLFNLTKISSVQKHLLKIIHSLTQKVIKYKKESYFKREQKEGQSLYQKALISTKYNEDEDVAEETRTFNYIRDDLDENDDVGIVYNGPFLDFMIEVSQTEGNTLSDNEIKDEVNTIMFEGHDTTAAASSFVLSVLGVHQDIQDNVFEELKEIFQDDLYRPVTFSDTLNMKYLERVILETLRLYPPVPLIGRIVNEDVQLVSGDYIIPKGATVGIGTYVIHRNPKYYPNPEKFDPDNFLPERCQSRPHYAYIPFSAGPRSCVGKLNCLSFKGRKYAMLKLKVLLASVLRKFRTVSLKDEKDFKLQADIILKREDGFQIWIEERISQGL
ncbi:hypothetical protein NQ318_005038, partial [Aromia moschata]